MADRTAAGRMMQQHVHDLKQAQLRTPSLVTIGVFDGLHSGHQALIRRLVEKAHGSGRLAVVITFFPHPDKVLRAVEPRYYLMTPQQRAAMLHRLGVDWVITHPFNDETRTLPAAEFVRRLAVGLKMQELWVGSDFALGYRREGDVAFLQAQGEERGFKVKVIELLMNAGGDAVIQTSQIRRHIQRGEMEAVRAQLGRAYALTGTVVAGQQRGRSIGFPTANLQVWAEQMIPQSGVYAGWAVLAGQRVKAVTNIGSRPTFDGAEVSIEAHLLDFERDIYGQELELSFETRLRAEKKFASVEQLSAQIRADAAAARTYLERHRPHQP